MVRALSFPSRITEVVENRVGKVQLLGRYHNLPRKLEDDFLITSTVLGTGFNGKVYMACRKVASKPDEWFAVKQFNLSKLSRKAASLLEAEVQIYLCMDHPHIARLVNVYETPKSLCLVMECMQGGELFDRIKAKKRFTEHRAAHVVKQILLAVHYLHWHGIAHRDLKPENFLCDDRDDDFLKLIDFGFSKFRPQGARMKTACGTMSYVAPEVFSEKYTSQCDVWSIGVISFLLLSGQMPFYGSEKSTREQILEGRCVMEPRSWNLLSFGCQQFTKALLEKDPSKRLTAKQALEHEWIKKHSEKNHVEPDSSVIFAFQQFSAAPKFRRCCLLAMAWLLTSKETARVRQEFCAINTDHQGTISLEELKVLMVERYQVPEDDILEIFQAMDINSDCEIHYSEFLAAMLSTRIDVNDKLLLDTFRNFDKDLSGYITAENLREAVGDSFAGEKVECLLEEVYPSEDGRMSFSEFASYVRGTPVDSQAVQMSYPPVSSIQSESLPTEVSSTHKSQACCTLM